ncbi:hypothetical protein DAPPUDRAFT_309213 [Daphnia pulex]|uniref:Uncharacterized protein n=1 Tax=Daphnia pulex TaxID=6669 RepID=E9HAU5_DAPPU|nr:hypothetical protein DAPPUDRAFT_309213 [Daphnia pulex]|eukprot:EFX71156.1 hypothetical protein DAPPUDRAFT_309213 [Daphnia pulex]
MEHSALQPSAHLALVELAAGAAGSSSSSFADRPSKVKLDDAAAIHLGVNGSGGDDPFFTSTASRLDLEPTTAGPHELSPVELAGVIVAAALITAALIGFGIWMHFRRKKSKSQELNSATGGRMNGGPNHHPVAPQVSVISMETDVRPAGEFASPKSSNSSNSSTMLASNLFRSRIIVYRFDLVGGRSSALGTTTENNKSCWPWDNGRFGPSSSFQGDNNNNSSVFYTVRQNSYGSTGYIGSLGPYRSDGVGQSEEDEMGSFTDYGSIVGSFPPSPAGSFRSAIDAPGFSRSRAGTGTSFATVMSFGSYRSRASNTASFHTCVEEEFS